MLPIIRHKYARENPVPLSDRGWWPNMNLEDEIFEVWKELYPSEAYSQGLEEYAGKLFVPTPDNCKMILKRIRHLKSKTEDTVQKKFLISLEATLKYREAPHDLSDIVWTLFGHLIKEGIDSQHISSLLDYSLEILNNSRQSYKLTELPMELKITLVNKCNSLSGILRAISNQTDSEDLKKKIEELSVKIGEYKEIIAVNGIEKGDFSEVFPILKEYSTGDMGRADVYPQILKDLFDHYETPEEIERKALSWLDEELPELENTARSLAEIYGIGNVIEAVDSEITKRRNVAKTQMMSFIMDFREKAKKVVEQRIVRINPKYDTKILGTPDYLLNFIPTAAMTMFDTLTDKPFNIFFITTDEKLSPPTSLPDLFQLVVHEEYGHCVNFSNSALSFAWEPKLVEKLNSSLHYPISEGISFHREYETLGLLTELAAQKRSDLLKEEVELLDALATEGDINVILLESKFIILKWRIIRFLRAVGDVRINMNKQSLTEFVEWASERTGFSPKTIYDQIFIFQEKPGYAPCYSLAGMAIKEIQEEAKKQGKDILEFNTITSSLGFPPRTVFEERLRNL